MNELPASIIDGPEQFASKVISWMVVAGQSRYDEAVTQLEHALQTANLARAAGDNDAAVVAALFHDVGHLLLHEQEGDPNFLSEDLQHEQVGANWVSQHFSDEVAGPIREHVSAKRYLCYVDSDYAGRLSIASTRSLQLQGGPMTPEEAVAFEALPWCQAAVKLRKRDEGAKVSGKLSPPIETYLPAVIACLSTRRISP